MAQQVPTDCLHTVAHYMKDCSVSLANSVFLCSNGFHRLRSANQLSVMSSILHLEPKMLALVAVWVSFLAGQEEQSGIPIQRELCQDREVLPEPSSGVGQRSSTNRLGSGFALYSCSWDTDSAFVFSFVILPLFSYSWRSFTTTNGTPYPSCLAHTALCSC